MLYTEILLKLVLMLNTQNPSWHVYTGYMYMIYVLYVFSIVRLPCTYYRSIDHDYSSHIESDISLWWTYHSSSWWLWRYLLFCIIYVKISFVFRVVLLYHSKYIRKFVNTGILKQITHHDTCSCTVSITNIGDIWIPVYLLVCLACYFISSKFLLYLVCYFVSLKMQRKVISK